MTTRVPVLPEPDAVDAECSCCAARAEQLWELAPGQMMCFRCGTTWRVTRNGTVLRLVILNSPVK